MDSSWTPLLQRKPSFLKGWKYRNIAKCASAAHISKRIFRAHILYYTFHLWQDQLLTPILESFIIIKVWFDIFANNSDREYLFPDHTTQFILFLWYFSQRLHICLWVFNLWHQLFKVYSSQGVYESVMLISQNSPYPNLTVQCNSPMWIPKANVYFKMFL